MDQTISNCQLFDKLLRPKVMNVDDFTLMEVAGNLRTKTNKQQNLHIGLCRLQHLMLQRVLKKQKVEGEETIILIGWPWTHFRENVFTSNRG